jgi:hypothetical protein
MLKLDVLRARHGDCLLLHAGDDAPTTRVLIDGGPSRTFTEALRPRMDALSRESFAGQPPIVDLAVISHIDSDHIGGFLKLLKHNANLMPNRPLLELRQLWHNSFHSLGGADIHGASSTPAAVVSAASLADQLVADALAEQMSDFGVVMAGVRQGNEVSELAARFRLDKMNDFPGGLVVSGVTVDAFDPLRIHVLGPRPEEIADLRKTWKKFMDALKRKAARVEETARSLDTSVANLSSIVLMVEHGGKRLLLTGDARGDYVVETLRDGGWLTHNQCHVDVFKWPHHGSIRNFPDGVFECIRADHHVVSANGKHHNPDLETIERFIATHDPAQTTTVHLTYSPSEPHLPHYQEHMQQVFALLENAVAAGHRITINTPTSDAKWLTVDLDD